ncbi:MAG: zinc-ribbon domain-containing protein, partial [Deltaproteobacteria bacterium]|nr:zinc-ribbon domain-containing protein [Deltaproteobacteria bacterium]
MRIKCDRCEALYNVSEEKIKGKAAGIKIKCKKCGNLISVSPAQTDEASYSASGSGEYFLVLSGQREGPFTAEEVSGMFKRGSVDGNTFYWKKGLAAWSALKEAEEFRELSGKKEDELAKTDFLPISEIKAYQRTSTSAFQAGSRAQETGHEDEKTVVTQMPLKEEKEESAERRVWERRETSVLFSLDDVKLKKKEETGIRDFRKEDAVIDLSAISQPGQTAEPLAKKTILPQGRRADARDTIISLEGVDLAQAAQALKLKKKRRKNIAAAASFVVVASAAAAWFLLFRPAPVPVTDVIVQPKQEAKIEKIEKAEKPAEKEVAKEAPAIEQQKPQK